MADDTTLNKITSDGAESSALSSTSCNASDTSTANTNLAQNKPEEPKPKKFSPEDVKILIPKLFADLNLGSIDFLLAKRINRRSRWTKLILLFRKRMFILSYAFQPFYELSFEEFFADVPIFRRNVFTLLSTHCFKIVNHCPNIYIAFIYTCCFVYAVAQFLKERSSDNFEKFTPMSVNEIYDYKIKKKFEALGGIDALFCYLQSNNVVDMIDLMLLIYTNPDVSKTNIKLISGKRSFGVVDNTCHKQLLKRIESLEYHTSNLFPVEMTLNTDSIHTILVAFTELEAEVTVLSGGSTDLAKFLIKHLEEDKEKIVEVRGVDELRQTVEKKIHLRRSQHQEKTDSD